MGENCKPACRGIRIQACELLDLSSSDKRLTRTHHRAWGNRVRRPQSASPQSQRLKIPRRPAQLTRADVARVIRAAKQAGASEAYTNNWNAVPLI